MLNLPAKTDPIWLGLVTGTKPFEFSLLGAKLLVGFAVRQVRANPAVAAEHAASLHGLYEKFQNTPAAQSDISRLL
jgi:hypothetical protein